MILIGNPGNKKGGPAIQINKDLNKGFSIPCDTYDSPSLNNDKND